MIAGREFVMRARRRYHSLASIPWSFGPFILGCLLAILANLISTTTALSSQPGLEAYGRLPQVEAISLSPGGQTFAAVVRGDQGPVLTVFDAETVKPLESLGLGAGKFRSLMWIDDDRIVIIRSVTAGIRDTLAQKGERFVPWEYNFRTRQGRPLLMNTDRALNIVAGGDPQRASNGAGGWDVVLYGFNFPQNKSVLTLFRQGETGTARVVAQGQRDTVDWIVGPDGQVLGEIRQFVPTGAWQVLVGRGQDARKLVKEGVSLIERPWFRGLSADGASVVVSVPGEDERQSLQVDIATGEVRSLSIAQEQRFVLEEGSSVILGWYSQKDDDLRYEFNGAGDQALWSATIKAFEGAKVTLQSLSRDRSRMIVAVEGKAQGYAYFLVDRRTGRANLLSDVFKGIGPEAIRERRFIHYRAADGREIPAYLTLPAGPPTGRLPLIVLPHGGPASRDAVGFDWWSQAYASLGYAVLQPQFRGSRGFGEEHYRAGLGEIGGRMQSDLSDGVGELARQGVVDPARVAIVGASYGGYAALAGVTLQSGIYRCAVSVAGVTDMAQIVRDFALRDGSRQAMSARYWRGLLAVQDERDPKLTSISPVFQASRASAPIQLIHGEDDTVVKIEHSRRMSEALKAAGRPVELVVLKGEDHWLSNGETRLQMLTESARFLKTCNPPDGSDAARTAADR